jgi:hypothetical protein
MGLKITGKLPSGEHLALLQRSPNYRDNSFQNLSATPMIAEDASYWRMAKDYFKGNKNARPLHELPSVQTDLEDITTDAPVIIWFGHSSYMIKLHGKTILVDPVFSGNAAPLSFMVKAFNGADVYKPADMPFIDFLIITHDHYDHLDFKTILQLKIRSVKSIVL